ncbi:amino acid--tRNA ligase-related protein [Thermovibrio sp.]
MVYAIIKNSEKLKEKVREFFKERGYTEVDTPYLVPYCNPDSNVENVKATFKDFSGKEFFWFLHTSPEFFMKRLLALGMERIFQVCKCFRSGEITELHNIEFTMVEWYRVNGDYKVGMEETEELIRACAQAFNLKELSFKGRKNSLFRFERISVEEAFKEFAKVNVLDKEEVIKTSGEESYEEGFFKLLVDKVEPALAKLPFPVFLYDYPKEFSAMAVVKGELSERFELYICGVEIANGYTELTDYQSYKKKFSEKGKCAIDKGFLNLIKEKPLPSCEGVALGFDRLLMLLTGKDRISDVQPFSVQKLLKEASL